MAILSQARQLWRRLTGSDKRPSRARKWLTTITVEWRGEVTVLPVSRVIVIEVKGQNVVFTTAERTYQKLGKIDDFEGKLDPATFLRIHRSTIVNKKQIARVSRLNEGRTNFHMSNDRVVGASQAYQDAINKAFPNLGK
jgi:two-component system LytT family response regulator